MKLFIKDRSQKRYTVFCCCEKCRKLVKKYTFDIDNKGPKRSETKVIVDTVKNRLKKSDLNYCWHCGERIFKE